MALFHVLLHFFPFIISSNLVQGQFIQGYTWQSIPVDGGGFSEQPFWRLTQNDVPKQVVYLVPETVFLVYNCYYMKDICNNANSFLLSPHGALRDRPTMFAYDLNKRRKSKRRDSSCPTDGITWASTHNCPEANQETVMRHDGPWPYKDLEPDGENYNIRNRRDGQGNIIEYSKLRYSCDEFPPATWVEGGSGWVGDSGIDPPEAFAMDAWTRCAAIRCGKERGVKAEQNWQGESHNSLRLELKRLARRRKIEYHQFPFFDEQDSAVIFFFRQINVIDGVAARVITYTDEAQSGEENERIVTQAKRAENDTTPDGYLQWADTVTVEELLASGKIYQKHVLVNESHLDVDIPAKSFSGINQAVGGMKTGLLQGMDSRWLDDDNDNENELHNYQQGGNTGGNRHLQHKRIAPLVTKNDSNHSFTPLLNIATGADLTNARQIVEDALAQSAKLNEARYANPRRNRYKLRPGTVFSDTGLLQRPDHDDTPPPLLKITDEMVDAAALISEADAVGMAGNVTKRQTTTMARSGTYWMEHLNRKGSVPWANEPNYKVFRNVIDYGAVGDGVTDDTKAIRNAMTDGKRCGEKCNGSTTKNAIVYFPPGTYRVSTPIPMPFGTQVIGDANDRPTLLASKTFIGLSVLSTDEYTGGGKGSDGLDQEWFINTANFYRQIRNIRIDITETRPASKVSCVHYQVAQATSMQNVELNMKSGSTQRGIFAENGSGGMIADVVFRGGSFGIYGGNQQFTAQRLTFEGCTTGVQVIWDWGWVWKSITMTNVDIGFRLLQENATATSKRQAGAASNGNIGSASFIDSSFQNVGTAVLIAPPSKEPASGSTGVILENVKFKSVTKAVADTSGATLLPASPEVDHWALGPVYSPNRTFSDGGKVGRYRRQQPLLNSEGHYFERTKPQYEGLAVGDFFHVKDFGARGDGSTDDTAAFQSALYASLGKVLFVDAGSYVLTSTVTVPVGSKIVGETWSQLVASGSYFMDPKNPKVMLKVGNEGDAGVVEMQDLIFTNIGPTAGLVMVEWNIRALTPGSAGLWDCHARIGGAIGTRLTPTECPPLTGGIAQGCNAASLIMHLTPKSSGYFENMWLWVSDHLIDDPDLIDANNTMVQNSVYVARGLLVESVEPTWLYGTSSEHSVFYQYNFNKAQNVFAGMIQTESPYYQPTPKPPAPFEGAVGVFDSDPQYECKAGDDFSGCDESWGVIIRRSMNIFIAGAGIYSWFSTYTQDCIDRHTCQKALILLENNVINVRIQHLITIGAKYMVIQDGIGISALDNLNVKSHPSWSQISVLDVIGSDLQELLWIDPKIWEMETPSFTCSPPCRVKLPPWTGATSTADYPLLTLTDGSWTSTMTVPPVTVSEWIFEIVTLEARANANLQQRQGFTEFWPVPATRPFWPAVTYVGPAGKPVVTSPSIPFPVPPASIGPNAPPPPKGSWPKRAVNPVAGDVDIPLFKECGFWDPTCIQDPWTFEGMPGSPDDDYDENEEEANSLCPAKTSSSTSNSLPSQTPIPVPVPIPVPSPMEHGKPSLNIKECYNSGRSTNHVMLQNAIRSFCGELGKPGIVLGENFFKKGAKDFPVSGPNPLPVQVVLSLQISRGCEWVWNSDECFRYLNVPVDSCDCGGADGKRGGTVTNNCLEWRIDPNNNWGG